MLKFYSYFKQATQGPCTGSRPAFYDIAGRAKYDAWKKLGNMSREEAMAKYVDELHTIVETMSYSDKVASFLEAPTNELDNLKMEDLQLIVGDVIARVQSEPNSPLVSRENSPSRLLSSLSSSRSASPVNLQNGINHTDDEGNGEEDFSDAEYEDTIETMDIPKKHIPNGYADYSHQNGYVSTHVPRSKTRRVDISEEIFKTISSLQADLAAVNTRIENVEKSLVKKSPTRQKFKMPIPVWAFIILWPIAVHFVMGRMNRRRL